MAERIRIGVTGNSKRYSPSWFCTRLALSLAGAEAVRISVKHEAETHDLQALVIGGGDDISPEHYGGDIKAQSKVDSARDELEIRWIRWALDKHVPMLGICRGAQLINVVLGGSLHQDIRPQRIKTYNRPGLLPTKQVRLESNSLVERVCGKSALRVNSLHSQAINNTGKGLRIVGHDLDNIVQAVESTAGLPIIGVQWHPEYLFYLPSQRALFRWLATGA